MLKLVAINVAVALVLLLVVLGGTETYLRLTIPASSPESIFERTLDTKRYKVMRRNARITAWGREFRTNSLGFRDSKDEIAAKAPGSRRVIVLGDSFTAAAGVDIDKTYPALLDRSLRSTVPGTDVINLAVGGYNLIQEELVLDEVAWSLSPDVILVSAFPFNDLSNDDYRANFEEATKGAPPPVLTAWYQQTYVYRAYLGRVEARVRRMFTSQPAPATASATPAATDTAPAENLAALGRIIDKARARNVEVVVALLPNTDDFSAQGRWFDPFRRECRANAWPCVDLTEDFIRVGAKPASLRLNVLDPHPNDQFNAIVAEALGDELLAALAKRP